MQDSLLDCTVSLEDKETTQTLALRISFCSPAENVSLRTRCLYRGERFAKMAAIASSFVLSQSSSFYLSVGRVGDIRSAKDKRLGEEAAEHGMHGVLPLKEVSFVVHLVIAISNGVPHEVHSGKLNEDLRSVIMRSFGLVKMRI